ncbi:MAG: energy-converting hydrogenase A subunit A EhaA [Methanobacteriaceae archaeon]|jgi:energy-converting hydrogenase A subunit A|nr:energy-converting hydrogenase A subunit A EhaA [Candidatus Methanorudis spinitermitis]
MIVHVGETYLLLSYLIAITTSIIIAIGLKMPILPEKPRRFSWTNSAVFPTPIIALGLLAICFSINFIWIYNGIVLAIITGVVSALFVKYLFYYVFPNPPETMEEVNE